MRRIFTFYLSFHVYLFLFLGGHSLAQVNKLQSPEDNQPATRQSLKTIDRIDLSIGSGLFVKETIRTQEIKNPNKNDFESMTNNGPIITLEGTIGFKGYSTNVIGPIVLTFLQGQGKGVSETNTNGKSLTGSVQESLDDRETRFLDVDLSYGQAQLSYKNLTTGLGYGTSLRVSPIHIDAITQFHGPFFFIDFVGETLSLYLRVIQASGRCHQADDVSVKVKLDDTSELSAKYNAFTCQESKNSFDKGKRTITDFESSESHNVSDLRYTKDFINPFIGEHKKWRWFFDINSMNSKYEESFLQDQNEMMKEKIYEHFEFGGGVEVKIY